MIKQNPFSFYDFLGYLIPGLVTFLIFKNIDCFTNFNSLFYSSILISNDNFKIESVTLLIIFSYILGHIVSFLSSITVERYAIWKYNFPSKYLLKIDYKGYWKSYKNYTDIIWRIFLIVILFPIVIFDYIFGSLLNFKNFYQQSLDQPLIDLIIYKSNKLLMKLGFSEIKDYQDDGCLNSSDFHRVLAHYAYEYSKNHQFKLSNYVALYGFLRTLSYISCTLTVFLVIKTLYNDNTIDCFKENYKFIIFMSFLSYVFFMAFMKFYRRYSLECMMVTTILNIKDKED